MYKGERFNAITHLMGAILTLAGVLALVVPPLGHGDLKKALGFAVYGSSLLLAYLTSTLYHSVRGEARELYRRYDRIAIYLLIAGTYTPVTLLKLPSAWGWPLLVTVWALAATGSAVEFLLAREKRTLSVALYVFMGWMSLLAIKPLMTALTVFGVAWLLAGGLFYTLGALALHLKLFPRSHEFWHVTVLIGSGCHFAMMLFYVS